MCVDGDHGVLQVLIHAGQELFQLVEGRLQVVAVGVVTRGALHQPLKRGTAQGFKYISIQGSILQKR